MTYIYVFVDESGDLGYRKDSSKYLVISYVFLVNQSPNFLEKEVSCLLREVNAGKTGKKRISEFKFSNDDEKTRQLFLNKINSLDVRIGLVVAKKGLKDSRKDSKHIYEYLISDFVLSRILSDYIKDSENKIHLILDKSMSKGRREFFNKYCIDYTNSHCKKLGYNVKVFLDITHQSSEKKPILQVADYIASSAFLKFEWDDRTFFDMIKAKIIHQHRIKNV